METSLNAPLSKRTGTRLPSNSSIARAESRLTSTPIGTPAASAARISAIRFIPDAKTITPEGSGWLIIDGEVSKACSGVGENSFVEASARLGIFRARLVSFGPGAHDREFKFEIG